MSEPSDWPLSVEALRIVIPQIALNELEDNALSRDCYPTALGYYPSAYRHQMRRKDHDDFLLMYCVSGSGYLALEEAQHEINAGDLLILPPGLAHRYAASESIPWSLFWCHFRGGLAEEFFRFIGLNRDMPILHGLTDMSLQAGFYSLIDIASGYGLESFIHASNQLRQLLSLVERLGKQSGRQDLTSSLQLVRNFMRDNLNRKLSLDELAAVSNLSKYHFTRKYRELTGYAPLQHFEHLKVEQACLMLESSQHSISEIAFQLGYDDPLYFSRGFRKVIGMSPSQYRSNWTH